VSIIPASIVNLMGTFGEYLPPGQVLTNMAHIQVAEVAVRPFAERSIDRFTYSLDPDGHCLFVECLDLKRGTLIDLNTATTEPVDVWVISGTKDPALNFYPIEVAKWRETNILPFEQSFIQFGDRRFRLTVPGDGAPLILHHIYDRFYEIENWYRQVGERQYFRSWHEPPRDVCNHGWTGDAVQNKPCAFYKEAWWAQSEGGWYFGGGDIEIKADGQSWPVGGARAYPGASETFARGLTTMWRAHVWAPNPWDEYAIRSE